MERGGCFPRRMGDGGRGAGDTLWRGRLIEESSGRMDSRSKSSETGLRSGRRESAEKLLVTKLRRCRRCRRFNSCLSGVVEVRGRLVAPGASSGRRVASARQSSPSVERARVGKLMHKRNGDRKNRRSGFRHPPWRRPSRWLQEKRAWAVARRGGRRGEPVPEARVGGCSRHILLGRLRVQVNYSATFERQGPSVPHRKHPATCKSSEEPSPFWLTHRGETRQISVAGSIFCRGGGHTEPLSIAASPASHFVSTGSPVPQR